jgi:hypothetical protein
MAINPPPPSRPNLQAQAVLKVKDDARRLFNLLDQYAGKTKTPVAEANVKLYMNDLSTWLPKVIAARDLRGTIPADWAQLKVAYNQGQGSWTKCLPYARQLNAALQQCEA